MGCVCLSVCLCVCSHVFQERRYQSAVFMSQFSLSPLSSSVSLHIQPCGWGSSQEILLSSPPISPPGRWGHSCESPHLVRCGIQILNSGAQLMQKVLYPLSHLSAPSIRFCLLVCLFLEQMSHFPSSCARVLLISQKPYPSSDAIIPFQSWTQHPTNANKKSQGLGVAPRP